MNKDPQVKKGRKRPIGVFGHRILILLLVLSMVLSTGAFAAETSPVTPTTPALTGGYDQLDLMIKSIKDNYYKDVPEDKLREALYKGMFEALDPHSVYFTPAEYKSFNESIQGSFTGVGISISESNGYIEVVAPIKNTPAYKAGIKSGDLITKIDGVDIKGWSTEQVAQRIRGLAGTAVTLTIQRKGESKPLVFKLVRELINLVTVEHEVKSNIDVIRMTSWDQNTYADLQKIMAGKSFKNGLIIDLRNNPGGLLSQVVNITDLFLKKGQRIVTVDYANQDDDVYQANVGGYNMPLVVLINGGSASASEIFAGAVQDHKRGILVGEKSYGKGTVQGLLDLPDQGAMKLTIASYRTPSDRDIHGKGVAPDVAVTNLTENDTVVAKFYDLQGLSTLKRGARTMEVIGAQQRLRYLGYELPVDGTFGTALESALKAFQKLKGLKVTGVIDLQTRIAINDATTALAKGRTVDMQMAEAIKQMKKLTGGQ